jgi:hypothetical protein
MRASDASVGEREVERESDFELQHGLLPPNKGVR